MRGNRFLPAHALFLAHKSSAFVRSIDLDGARLGAFLAGEALPLDTPGEGYTAVCWRGYPLGFGKLTGGTLKNHLPKGLRLR